MMNIGFRPVCATPPQQVGKKNVGFGDRRVEVMNPGQNKSHFVIGPDDKIESYNQGELWIHNPKTHRNTFLAGKKSTVTIKPES